MVIHQDYNMTSKFFSTKIRSPKSPEVNYDRADQKPACPPRAETDFWFTLKATDNCKINIEYEYFIVYRLSLSRL
jgi:hypothetical protein